MGIFFCWPFETQKKVKIAFSPQYGLYTTEFVGIFTLMSTFLIAAWLVRGSAKYFYFLHYASIKLPHEMSRCFFTHVSTSCETFGKQKGWILKENMITVLQLMQDFVGWICKSLSCVFRPLQQWGKILCITCKVIVWVMLNFGCQSNRFLYFCNRNNIEYYM